MQTARPSASALGGGTVSGVEPGEETADRKPAPARRRDGIERLRRGPEGRRSRARRSHARAAPSADWRADHRPSACRRPSRARSPPGRRRRQRRASIGPPAHDRACGVSRGKECTTTSCRICPGRERQKYNNCDNEGSTSRTLPGPGSASGASVDSTSYGFRAEPDVAAAGRNCAGPWDSRCRPQRRNPFASRAGNFSSALGGAMPLRWSALASTLQR